MRGIARGTVDTTPRARRGGRHRADQSRPRSLRRLVIFAAAIAALVIGAGMLLMFPARGPLLEGRDALQTARTRLNGGDVPAAEEAFVGAEEAFDRAAGQLGNPLTQLAGFVPILGRTPDAVSNMADAGALVAQAGRELAGGIERLPGGLGALAPRGGVIDVQSIEALAPPVAQARDLVVEADRLVRGSARTWIPDPVAGPLFQLQDELAQARRAVVSADALVRALPSFLGAEGSKRYFVAAQNPAELRGTGGLIGSYAILTVEGGRIGLGEFRPIQRLQDAIGAVESPNPDYETLYIRWGGAGFWSNLNRTPDFPSAATAIERLYEEVEGIRLDGVIASDPHAFAELLEATGPAEIPRIGVTVDSGNVVPFVTNEAYVRFPDSVERKRVLGDVAGHVLGRFLNAGASGDPLAAGRAMIEAAAGGHLLFHSIEPNIQEGFDLAGLSGRLVDPPGDYLAVIVNNNGGNKIDFYLDRTIRYEVRLGPEGVGESRAVVRMHNEAPSRGLPAYIIGPFPLKEADPGENVSVLQTYCARGCTLRSYDEDGVPGEVEQHTELGHPVVLSNVRLPSGGRGEMTYRWVVPRAWSGDAGGGIYRLTFQGQPGIRGATLELDIRVPPGTRIIRATEGLRVVGDRAVWRGPAEDLARFEVEFHRSLFSFRG
jgi:hypothetical protein